MPDLGNVMMECNNCGKGAMWTFERGPDGAMVRVMPHGWRSKVNTLAGDLFFCSSSCEKVFLSKHDDIVAPVPEMLVRASESKFCECGLGPFARFGMIGHKRGAEHRERMMPPPAPVPRGMGRRMVARGL